MIFLVCIQIRRVDLDCLGVAGEVERRRLQAAVRELGIQGATQVLILISVFKVSASKMHVAPWILVY